MTQVKVNRKAAGRAASGHPWIFSSDVTDLDGAQPGDVVTVLDPNGRPLGTAHYSSTSQIALRMLSSKVEQTGREFFLQRLRAAEAHRRAVVSDSDSRWWSIATPITWCCKRSIRAWTAPFPKS
jgi:23S rRNA (cytosine1962-C5)-methyltransferase